MFGYIRPATGELKLRELEYYRAAYCGMCRSMGSECGAASRLCLSYDLTFLSLVIMTLTGEKPEIKKNRCPANCLAKKKMTTSSFASDYSAAACGILASLKFTDEKNDETGARRAAASMAEKLSAPWIKRADEHFPGLADGIIERLDRLSKAEDELWKSYRGGEDVTASAPADSCAGLFGELLSFVFSYPFDGDSDRGNRAIASAVGSAVGRWIYIVDAVDDLKKDAEKKRFNPLLMTYTRPELTDDEKLTLKCHLAALSGSASDALLLCDRKEAAPPEPMGIIDNILSFGMRAVADQVFEGSYNKPHKDKM